MNENTVRTNNQTENDKQNPAWKSAPKTQPPTPAPNIQPGDERTQQELPARVDDEEPRVFEPAGDGNEGPDTRSPGRRETDSNAKTF